MSTATLSEIAAMQRSIAQTLLEGPHHCPPHLFADSAEAYLRGLRVYATTISHARLVALEDTFPKCRDFLGAEEFNNLSRSYLDDTQARGYKIADIGAGFVEYLQHQAARDLALLATIEWAWLAAYSAAEAAPLTLAEIATYSEAELLDLRVVRHPSLQLVTIPAVLANIPPLFDDNLPAASGVVMIHRPETEIYARFVPHTWQIALASAIEPVSMARILEILASNSADNSAEATDTKQAEQAKHSREDSQETHSESQANILAFIQNSILIKARDDHDTTN